MADYHLQFSEIITGSKKEIEWLATLMDNISAYTLEQEIDIADQHDKIFVESLKDQDSCLGLCLGFDFSIQDDGLWVSSMDYGSPEVLSEIVQYYLRKFGHKEKWVLRWSSSCSKPRVGEFGGGAVIVSADKIEYMDTWAWVNENT